MVKIQNVGSNHGDCFFIEIENNLSKNVIMVDGRRGDKTSFEQIKEKISEYDRIDYLIVTHIDSDHINGVLKIYKLPETNAVRRAFEGTVIFYNCVTKPIISFAQAKEFERLIQEQTVAATWRKQFKEYCSPCLKILSASERKNLDPRVQPNYRDRDYAVLTFLRPHKADAEKLCQKFYQNQKASSELINRNSIVFLLEYGDHAAVFTGDCYMEDIIDEIDQLKNMCRNGQYRKIDVLKMPHHGARANNEKLAEFAKKYAVSDLIVTGKETWDSAHPSQNILEQLNHAAPGPINLYTHVKLGACGFMRKLDKIRLVERDIIEWR